MNPIDTYRDAFLGFLDEGMTPAEAMAHFDDQEWGAAVREELSTKACRYNPTSRAFEAHDGLPSLLELSIRAGREQSNARDMEEQAIPLWLAGWTSESPSATQRDVMSWYWRAPSKRPGRLGRRYLSTNQAFTAMKRATP